MSRNKIRQRSGRRALTIFSESKDRWLISSFTLIFDSWKQNYIIRSGLNSFTYTILPKRTIQQPEFLIEMDARCDTSSVMNWFELGVHISMVLYINDNGVSSDVIKLLSEYLGDVGRVIKEGGPLYSNGRRCTWVSWNTSYVLSIRVHETLIKMIYQFHFIGMITSFNLITYTFLYRAKINLLPFNIDFAMFFRCVNC